jgi:gamma-glutamyl:cysteine ligase YbdK (ATP-grasp superfamily)
MLNSYERDLLRRSATTIDDLHEKVAAGNLEVECFKVAMDMVSEGKRAPFTSFEELRDYALEIANSDPKIYKQAMAIVDRQQLQSLGTVAEPSRQTPESQQPTGNAEATFVNNLRNIGGH